MDGGDDYSMTFEGNVTDSLVIDLCSEEYTAPKKNTSKEGDKKGKKIKRKKIKGKKKSSPCDEDLKIKGDVSNSVIIHGVGKLFI